MGKTTLILASILVATTSIAADWFVAKDGDDANSGASRAEAKATIPAACACLSSPGDRLVIGDGDWSISEPIVLTNGWCATGEHGRGATTLIPSLATNIFVLSSAESSISGLTIDFNNIANYNTIAGGLVAINPVGSISNCLVKNYKSTWGNGLIMMNNAASHLVVDRCDFDNCYISYWTAVFYLANGTADFSNCTFTNCRGCNNSYQYFNYGMIYATKASTFRNCLFLRCKAAGRSGTSDSSILTFAANAGAVAENCSFIDCAVLNNSNGGALGCQTLSSGTGGTAYNCLAYNCVNNFGPAGLMSGLNYSHCAQETALAGEGNVIVNDANSTFRSIHEGRSIPLTGPALDGGVRRDWMTGATDIAGTARVVGDAPDIGCYENSGVEPATYYVAKDGDDANPGTSRALAKATIAAGYALLSDYDERLVICDGEWEFGLDPTFVISNGWTVCSENGPGSTTLKLSSSLRSVQNSTDLDVVHPLFALASLASTLSGFTIDFNNVNCQFVTGALVALNPTGIIRDCTVKNYCSSWANALIRMTDAASHLVVDRCNFDNCYVTYSTAVFYLTNGTADFSNCTFTNCRGGNNSYTYFNYGVIYATKASTFRNCLFLRCKAGNRSGTSDSSILTFAASSGAVAENCSFIDCAVLNGSNGGALGCQTLSSGTGGTAYNCLAYNCVNDFGPAGLMGGITYSHCAQETALDGEGNVIVNDANSTFRSIHEGRSIPLTGPALDGGVRRDWMTGATDIAGTARVVGDAPDIGCYENSGVEPATYYVAKDGDDANPGTSRALAKATIAAGYALLSDYDERLVICDGEWEFGLDPTFVISNGWTVCSENGPGSTKLKLPSTLRSVQNSTDLDVVHSLFALASPAATLSGFTIDFNNVNCCYAGSALVALNSTGIIRDCTVRNYYSSWSGALIMMNDAASHLVVDRCNFDNCRIAYSTAVFYLASGTADFSNCAFTSCRGCNDSYQYFNYGVIYATKASTFRNCLFLRCKAAGRSGTSDSSILTFAANAGAVAENCSFIDCAVLNNSNGGALGCQTLSSGTGGTAYNCLAYNCVNDFGPAGLMGGITYSHCAQETALAGEGNVVVNDANSTFSNIHDGRGIPLTGPALDGGVRRDWMTRATDIAGTARVVGEAPDIGCYENSGVEPTPATYYVAKDGDDANPGTSRALAKATIAAGYALLSGYDERLVIGDGEWEFGLDPTFVISNGWTVCSENGPGSTTLKLSSSLRSVQNSTDLDVVHPLFSLASFAATLSGFTIDFNNVNCSYAGSALVALNPMGIIRDCTVKNYYSSWGNALIMMNNAVSHLVVDRCNFDNCYVTYWTAVIRLETGTADFTNCTFANCRGCKDSYSAYNYGMIYATKGSTFRNCLFLRCKAGGRSGDSDSSILTFAANAGAVAENCSFIDCAVINGSNGGALGCKTLSSGTGGTAYNCLAYGCANTIGKADFMAGITYSHCAGETEVGGEGYIVLTGSNFRFRNRQGDDYTVMAGPTVNAGTNRTWMVGATDLAGNRRIIDNIVDIGCYERDRPKPTQILLR